MTKEIDKLRDEPGGKQSFYFGGSRTEIHGARPDSDDDDKNVDIWSAIGELQTSLKSVQDQLNLLNNYISNLNQSITSVIIGGGGNVNVSGGYGINVTESPDDSFTVTVVPTDFLVTC